MDTTAHCADCGWTNTSQHRPRRLVPVVDEDGTVQMCIGCVAVLVLRSHTESYDVTLMLSAPASLRSPTAVPA